MSTSQPAPLSPEDRAELLRIARHSLAEHFEQRLLVLDKLSAALLEPRGAFVSLHQDAQLRGCIGTFEASAPLAETVQRMAIAAATTDPRFPAVRPAELSRLHIEISVLSPLRESRPEAVQIGAHGIYITRGHQRGVLLPQVATEHGWDRETFLAHTCLKAGLPPEAWRDPETRLEVFSAEIIQEKPAD